jgi:hypothetical protein
MAPLAIDLFCGLGGWTDGLLAEGYDVIGFDIERHDYGTGGYPAQLVLQDVLTLRGAQFKDADLIVASPPCQAYSYRAMPWSRAKALPPPDNALFDACFRIQREACAAAGHRVPMVVENVRGAQKWVGRSRWNYGSFHLWGDVPALMPMAKKFKSHGMNWSNRELRGQDFTRIAGKQAVVADGIKLPGNNSPDRWSDREIARLKDYPVEGVKFSQSGAAWFDGTPRDKMLGDKGPAAFGSKSSARKAASAVIAKIPFPLARYLARVFKPQC